MIKLKPTMFSGCENGGTIFTSFYGQQFQIEIVDRDATKFLSLILPNLNDSDLKSIKNMISSLLWNRSFNSEKEDT